VASPLTTRSPNGDLYVWALSSNYHDGARVFDPSVALANDPDVYTKLRRDPVIAGAINKRVSAISGRTWRLVPASDDPADKRLAAVLEHLIRQIPRFSEARRLLAEADIIGCRYAAITGAVRSLKVPGDTAARLWWVPGRLIDVDRRRFRAIATRTGEQVSVRWEVFALGAQDWVPVANPDQYVKHLVYDAEETLGYGRGLIEALHDGVYAKTVALKEGLQGLKRWAQGLLTAKVHGGRDAQTGLPNIALLRAWATELDRAQGENSIAHDADDEIQVHSGPGTGHQIVTDFVAYFDSVHRCLINGSDLPTAMPSSGTGSYALGKVQENTSEAIVQGSQEMLDDTITCDIVAYTRRVNAPILYSMGLSEAQMPRFETVNEKIKDPKVRADTISVLLSAGVRLKAEEVYAETGFTPPEDGDEVIEPRPLPTFGGDGGFGGFGGDRFGEKSGAQQDKEQPADERVEGAA
jgi:hypothetical protein